MAQPNAGSSKGKHQSEEFADVNNEEDEIMSVTKSTIDEPKDAPEDKSSSVDVDIPKSGASINIIINLNLK